MHGARGTRIIWYTALRIWNAATRRRTLVVGVVDPPAVAEPDAQARLMWSDMQDLRGRRGERLYDEPLRVAYWR